MKKHVSLLRLIEWVAIRFLQIPTVSQSVWQSVGQSVSQCSSQSARLTEEQSDICKGNKFLRKLWCCVGGGVLKDNFWINWVDNVNWPSMWRVSKADISSVSYSSERIEELWVAHVCLYAGNEARLLVQDLDCLSVRVSLSINSFCTLTICMTFSAATITCGSLWSLSFGNDKKKKTQVKFYQQIFGISCMHASVLYNCKNSYKVSIR